MRSCMGARFGNQFSPTPFFPAMLLAATGRRGAFWFSISVEVGEMEPIRKAAVMCITRGVMFGTLAIACVMFAFSFNPPAAFRTGAVLTLVMAVVLLLKAHYVLYQKPKHTEIWLYLDEHSRPRDAEAVRRFAAVLREVYGRFAAGSFAAACGMFLVSVLMIAAGMEVQAFSPVPR